MGKSQLDIADFVMVGLYFAAVLGAGLYSMCRSNRGTVSGYFLAGRYMLWLPVGASLFASNIGSEHFIGLSGSGAAAGIAVGAFELNACMLLQLLGWVFLPVYIASGVCTLPEYMKKRFGGQRIRIYLASLSLMLYIFTKVSVNLYSGALFIQQALHWNLYISVILLLVATAFCTVTGGLAAVIYTDTLQALVMVAGAFVLMVVSFLKVGGFSELYVRYMEAIPNTTLQNPNATCGYPREDSWTMLRNAADSDMPWPAFLLGQTPASIWYWCADQMMVQRALAAKSLSHAQGGTLFAGYIKILPLFLMVLPGMISRVLFTEEVACADPEICMQVCQNPVGCSNIAYPKLVLTLLPAGMKGLMLSVMLAALMSDLTSIFNSASTLFTMDIYQIFRKKASVRELMIVGRVFVVFMTVIGILWIPLIQEMQGGQLFIYIQVISAYLAPPIAAVYIIAILWKRGNEKGAFTGLMFGLCIGMVRMSMDFVWREPACYEEDTRPWVIGRVHYMYFATFLFWVTGLIMVIVSLITKQPTEAQLIRTTYWTRFEKDLKEEAVQEVVEKDHSGSQVEKKSLIDQEKMHAKGQSDLENGHTDVIGVKYSKIEDGTPRDVTNEPIVHEETVKVVHKNAGGDVTRTDTLVITTEQVKKKKHLLRHGYDWFCGFDDTEQGIIKKQEQQLHIAKITSLKQNPRAKTFLNINVVFLFTIAIAMYTFFTIGIKYVF